MKSYNEHNFIARANRFFLWQTTPIPTGFDATMMVFNTQWEVSNHYFSQYQKTPFSIVIVSSSTQHLFSMPAWVRLFANNQAFQDLPHFLLQIQWLQVMLDTFNQVFLPLSDRESASLPILTTKTEPPLQADNELAYVASLELHTANTIIRTIGYFGRVVYYN